MGVSEKCKLTATFLAGERFDSVFWKNKVGGTQNLTYDGKIMPKVLGPTNEKMQNWKNWFLIILWSRSRKETKVGANVF